MKIAIATLGCKVNQSESASISGLLKEKGHEIVPMLGDSNPDVCIVNTCTVTAKSDYQSRQLIRRAIKTGARVIATGCYAQLRFEELSRIKGLDLIIGNSHKEDLFKYIDNKPENNTRPIVVLDPPDTPVMLRPYFSTRARAFLKIQDGCNLSCTYCAVPMARGKSRSLSPRDILTAVDMLSLDGYKEVVLTGIHIGTYGLDLQPESSLLEIVDKVSKYYPQIRIRLSSIEPQEFKKEFISLIKDKNVCPHLHIPLQSGSDKILKAMNRGYSTSFFYELINEIHTECPDISIGTDVIVGFPGEGEDDFEDTAKFLEGLPLSYIHVFPYSKRSGTRAESLPGHISSQIKKNRAKRILSIAKNKKNAYILRHLGQKLDVIVEEKLTTDGLYRVISDNYIRPLVKANDLIPGQRLHVIGAFLSSGELICNPL